MLKRKFLLACALLIYSCAAIAGLQQKASNPSYTPQTSNFGMALWLPIISKDPPHLHGFRAAINYQPPGLMWEHLSIYFDVGYGHWWLTGNHPNRCISIYSAAPYFRFYFVKKPTFSPYIEVSIGPSYINRTRFDDYNQGMHFSFQDQITLGCAFGHAQNFYFAFTALHYSNGSMSNSNAGITVPLILNIGYRF